MSSNALLLVLTLVTLMLTLKTTALPTDYIAVLLVGLSRVKYCQIADMLLALSDSHEINFLAPKTVVTRGSPLQISVLAFRTVKKN